MAAEIYFPQEDHSERLGSFTLIGRSRQAGITIDDPSVSREHCSVRRQGASHWFTDLGSSNGSYINGVLVTSAQKLSDGDAVRLGSVEATFVENSAEHSAITGSTSQELNQTTVLKRAPSPVSTSRMVLLVGDLCGFTNMSSKLGADELARLIDGWYESCRKILGVRGAVIDKFIGDCVFAYWTTDTIASMAAAVDAAQELAMSGSDDVSQTRQLIMDSKGVEFDCRVGLHCGEVAIGGGSAGGQTALGDEVNLAFRVEALTRPLEAQIVATEAFFEGWPEGIVNSGFRDSGEHPLKGFTRSVRVYAAG